MTQAFLNHLATEIDALKSAGLYKSVRVITSKQKAEITVASGAHVLNGCATITSALPTMTTWRKRRRRPSTAMATAWPRCASSAARRRAQATRARIASFLGFEDSILYSSCFDANGGLFETLRGEENAIISDALNHASIIDGVRLSKASASATPTTTWRALEES